MNKRCRLVLYAAAVSFCGCAEQEIRKAYQNVEHMAEERTGRDVVWSRGDEAEEQIAASLETLLQSELTADQAVQIALLNNRRLQAMYSEVGIAAAQLVEAGLLKNPVLTGQIRFLHHRPIWEFDVAQDFLDVLLLPLELTIAKADLEAAKLRVTAQVIDVASETRRTFYEYQAELQLLELWHRELLSLEATYEMAMQLRKSGNLSERELAQEQTDYEQIKLDVADAELRAVQRRERLNILMGLWGNATAWKAKAALPDLPEQSFEMMDIERQAIEKSLDLKTALLNIQAEAKRAGLESINAAIPELTFGGAVESDRAEKYRLDRHKVNGQNKYKLKDKVVEEWQAGPYFSFPLPIFNWGQAAFAVGKMEVLRLWNNYTALAVDIRAAARAAGYRVSVTHQKVVFTQKEFLPVWNDFFEETNLQYNAMFIGVLDLLHTKSQQLRNMQRAVDAQREYWIARTDLEQLLMGSAEGVSNFDQLSSDSGRPGGMRETLQQARESSRGGSQGNNQMPQRGRRRQ